MNTKQTRLAVSLAMAVAAVSLAAGCSLSSPTPQTIYITDTFAPAPVTAVPLASASATAAEATPDITPEITAKSSSSASSPSPTKAGPTASPTGVSAAAGITSITVTDGGTTAQCGAWKVTFKKPVVAGVSGADAINTLITAQAKTYIDEFKAQLSMGGGAGPCTLDGSFAVGLNSQTVLSLAFTMTEYLGGASNAALVGSLTVGVADGALISLPDLFISESAGAAVLSTQSRILLKALIGPTADVGWINTGTTPYVSNFADAWVMRAGGLQIAFPQLQVASAAAGTPTISIPWASLKSSLKANGPAGTIMNN
ncbi:MAG TPA: hypothetical protein VF375_10570 [Candidatus Limnocylindrales bacterium]